MNEKEEVRELIFKLINLPQHCIFCGGVLEDFGETDAGYHMDKCSRCGAVFSEE